MNKLELFKPLAEELTEEQIINIVESHMKRINQKKYKPRPHWLGWLLGRRKPTPGGYWDFLNDF